MVHLGTYMFLKYTKKQYTYLDYRSFVKEAFPLSDPFTNIIDHVLFSLSQFSCFSFSTTQQGLALPSAYGMPSRTTL